MIKTLPEKPNIEFYKKQAKRLLKERCHADHKAKLSDVQFDIAREHGFPSWSRFVAKIEELSLDFNGKVELFVKQSCTRNFQRAKQMISDEPRLAEANFITACLTGNIEMIRRLCDKDPTLITKKQGPKDGEALVYTCLSCFSQGDEQTKNKLIECAEFFLANGADPNATYKYGIEPEADAILPVLFAAVWEARSSRLTEMLLKAGANPNDGESLYHSTEYDDHQCMNLLIQYGAKEEGTNALIRKLDFDDLEGLETLLKAGANPNERRQIYFGCNDQTALHKVVMSTRSSDFMKMLLKFNGDPSLKDEQGMSVFRLAFRFGRQDIIDCLIEAGYQEEPNEKDKFLHYCMLGIMKRKFDHLFQSIQIF